MDLNVLSNFLARKAAGPHLKDGGGKVVKVAWVLGQVALREEVAVRVIPVVRFGQEERSG
jgi:hypothetical protein